MIKNYKTYAVLWLQMPQHLSNTKKMMMNVSKNKAFLIAGVAVLGLGVGTYFLFFRQKKGAYNPNDTNLNANPAAAADYRKQLQAFSKSQK